MRSPLTWMFRQRRTSGVVSRRTWRLARPAETSWPDCARPSRCCRRCRVSPCRAFTLAEVQVGRSRPAAQPAWLGGMLRGLAAVSAVALVAVMAATLVTRPIGQPTLELAARRRAGRGRGADPRPGSGGVPCSRSCAPHGGRTRGEISRGREAGRARVHAGGRATRRDGRPGAHGGAGRRKSGRGDAHPPGAASPGRTATRRARGRPTDRPAGAGYARKAGRRVGRRADGRGCADRGPRGRRLAPRAAPPVQA